jgi:hypothetical protein
MDSFSHALLKTTVSCPSLRQTMKKRYGGKHETKKKLSSKCKILNTKDVAWPYL